MTRMSTAEFFEEQARATKTYRLAVCLADVGVTPVRALRAHLSDWAAWAELAGVREPSVVTIGRTVDVLGHIVDLRAALAEDDPFAGLPA